MRSMELETEITGVEIAYYYTCSTQLWLFSHGLAIANSTETEDILIGRILHENKYKREKKEMMNRSKLDVIKLKEKVVVYEYKKGTYKRSHKMQLYFYLYQLKKKGFKNVEGYIIAPKKREKLILNEDIERELEDAMKAIMKIKELPDPPPPQWKSTCKKCAFKEFCFSGKDE